MTLSPAAPRLILQFPMVIDFVERAPTEMMGRAWVWTLAQRVQFAGTTDAAQDPHFGGRVLLIVPERRGGDLR
jgi:hypothetical protein